MQDNSQITLEDTPQFVCSVFLCDTSNRNLCSFSKVHDIRRPQVLPTGADFLSFLSLRAKIMSTVHTRPNIAGASSYAYQTTSGTFFPEFVNLLNRIVRHLKPISDIYLRFQKLDQDSIIWSYILTLCSRTAYTRSQSWDTLSVYRINRSNAQSSIFHRKNRSELRASVCHRKQ